MTCPEHQIRTISGSSKIVTANYPPAQATDNGGEDVTLIYSIPTGGTFQAGTTVVTVTGVDVSGNRGHCSFKMYIVKCKFNCIITIHYCNTVSFLVDCLDISLTSTVTGETMRYPAARGGGGGVLKLGSGDFCSPPKAVNYYTSMLFFTVH